MQLLICVCKSFPEEKTANNPKILDWHGHEAFEWQQWEPSLPLVEEADAAFILSGLLVGYRTSSALIC